MENGSAVVKALVTRASDGVEDDRYSDFTIYVPRVHIPDARWLDGRVKWTRPKRGGPISKAGRSRSSGGWGRREGESRSAGRRGWREGRAALGLRRAGIAPGEKGTLRRGMVRGSRVGWGKAPTLKFNATYLVDYQSVGLLWPELGVFTSIPSYSENLSDILYSISIMLQSFMILHKNDYYFQYFLIFVFQ